MQLPSVNSIVPFILAVILNVVLVFVFSPYAGAIGLFIMALSFFVGVSVAEES